MRNKKWDTRLEKVNIDNDGKIPSLVQCVLAARGLTDSAKVSKFLDTDIQIMGDPFLLPDMDIAVKVIKNAMENGTKIAVYGDYDVDGVTATCILIKYFLSKGIVAEYYIPDRMSEGYGLNSNAIRLLYDKGVGLIITVDSGITAVSEVELARSLGMQVIVTDHHECKEELPNALAVVNPRRVGSAYPFCDLAGVGVAFKLLCGLESGVYTTKQMMEQYGDIVAIGTIADVMPLVLENRAIVAQGLKVLERTKNMGLAALMKKLNIGKGVTATNVSFMMAPRINAAGRLGGAANAAKMLLTDKAEDACDLAELLCQLNTQRQEAENEIFKEISKKMDLEYANGLEKSIVLWGKDWHNGVIGIVASRLADRYYVPTILISTDDTLGKGSGRSIKGFNLYQALERSSGFLEKYGGHEMAVGLTIKNSCLQEFRHSFNQHCVEVFKEHSIVPTLNVDCRIEVEFLDEEQVAGLSILEPFGMGNPQPVFSINDMLVEEIVPIGKDRHIKLKVSKDGRSFCALAFGYAPAECTFACGDYVDIAFSADINDFRGQRSVQLIVKDIKLARAECESDALAFDIYKRIQGGHLTPTEAIEVCPARDDLVSVFRHFKTRDYSRSCNINSVYRKIRYEAKNNMNKGKLLVCMDILKEFGIITYNIDDDNLSIAVNDINSKVDISSSLLLQKLWNIAKHEG